MNIDDVTKRFIIYRLKWFGLYLCIGLVLVFFLPFPYDFASVLGLFILIIFFRTRSMMIRYGRTRGLRDLFGFLSSSMSGNDQHGSLRYYCMDCGKEHKEIACPNCGSKMKRAG
jgi:hypothetical protein